MDKRIGNVFLFWLIVNVMLSFYATEVTMKLLDANGEPTKQVEINRPFILEVTVKSDGNSNTSSVGIPDIAGIKQLIIDEKTHASTINRIVNGHRSSKKIYRYTVHADKLGTFQVGPARVVMNNKAIQSNNVQVHVVNYIAHKSHEPLLLLNVDKKQAVLGEPIQFSISFYPAQSATLEGISQPQFNDCKAGQLEGPYTGKKEINGVEREFIEWRTTLYPDKVGTITIPAVAAIYKTPRKQTRGFDFFDRMFSGHAEQKQVFSNTAAIQIDSLPPSSEPVHAIGSVSAVKATMDHQQAKEGEAVVYTLQVESNGDLHMLDPVTLQLPEGLKYYESKTYKAPDKHKNKTVNNIEYIVQGVKPGTYTIGEQTFRYFDLKKRNYEALNTEPLALHVTPMTSSQSDHTQQDHMQQDQAQQGTQSTPQILTILHDGPWREQPERSLSWYLFYLVGLLPLAVMGRRWFLKSTVNASLKTRLQKNFALKKAQGELRAAHNNNDVSMILPIFLRFFAQKKGILPHTITQEHVDAWLQRTHITDELLQQWHEWYNIMQFCTYGQQATNADTHYYFEKAQEWLITLNELL